MENTEKKGYLFKNMALFTVSSFVSKILVFFLVPFYTSVLTEAEYGIADVMQSSLLLFVPLLSINAGETALRYALEYSDDRDMILAAGLKRVLLSFIPAGLLSAVLLAFFPAERPYFLFFIVLYAADSLYEYMLLYCQGTEEVKKMVCGSVSCTVLVIASNLLFLLVFKMGLYGYLFAQITAFAGAALIMFILTGGIKRVRNAAANRELEREMTVYGSSMLLYSTASWVNNAIDRYYILFMLGSVQNGLYGVAYKIPAILATLQRIFAMAWQMSAVKEYKGDDRDEYFSEMYRLYQAVLTIGCAFIILFLKVIARIMFQKDFYAAWTLVPPLVISIILGALEGFLGSIALAFKDGKSMGRATGIGAAFNIVLNYIFIKSFGTFGAALATLISYFVMFALAYVFVSRYVRLKVSYLRDALAFLLLFIESWLIINEAGYYPLINALIVLLLLIMYIKELREIIKGSAQMLAGKVMR